MPIFRFDTPPSGSAHVTGQHGALVRPTARHTPYRSVTASTNSGGGSTPSFGGRTDRFNPISDRLELGSIVEQMIPRTLSGLNELFRKMYARDGVLGTGIDIWAYAPWSGFDVVGVKDPAIRRFFEDAFQIFGANAEDMIPLSAEYLTQGRVCASLLYDSAKGYWTDFLPHDQDLLTFTPLPVRGFDPKIDLALSPGDRQWVHSDDYRDRAAFEAMPSRLLEAFKSGQRRIPLDPFATLFAARRTGLNDRLGTSLLTRATPIFALEIALLDAHVTGARRRAGELIHVKVGIENVWEPTADEMAEIGASFQRAEEDVLGGIVTTGQGVDVSPARAMGTFIKWTDEMEGLANQKMRAIGLSEALMNADASLATADNASNLFTERARQERMFLVRDTYLKMATTLARAHGFVRRSVAELEHRVRVNRNSYDPALPMDSGGSGGGPVEELILKNLTQDRALQIPKTDLIVPGIAWHKQLAPESDTAYLDVMDRLEGKGLPIPLRMWASRGGFNIDDALAGLDEDLRLRKKFAAWKAVVDNGDFSNVTDDLASEDIESADNQDVVPGQEDAADATTPRTAPAAEPAAEQAADTPEVQQAMTLQSAALWDRARSLPGFRYPVVARVIAGLNPRILGDREALLRTLYRKFDGNRRRVEVMSYLLMRAGLTTQKLPMSRETVDDLVQHITQNAVGKESSKLREVMLLHRIQSVRPSSGAPRAARSVSAAVPKIETRRADVVDMLAREDELPQQNIVSGISVR